MKKFEFTSVLGWSVSRYDKFSTCKRAYFYDYYGKFDTEYPRYKIEALKKLTSMPLEIGNVVHDTAKVLLERLLKSEGPIDRKRFIEYAGKLAEENCKKKAFMEEYYRETGKVKPEALFNQVELSLNNFLNSDRFAWIIEKAITNKKDWVIEPPGYGETRIDGMKAYCKVDFLFPVDGEVHILDWKTGKPDEEKHKKQLLGYSTWACYHLDTMPERVFPVIVYLQPVYNELKQKFDENDTKRFIQGVKDETSQMQTFCRDVEQNIPKDKEEFSMTDRTIICKYCNYRELCKRNQ